ncbi:hypothetical protein [Rhizobium phaseoli]|uniref:hypothetical protein n=1 Tax=Rhizobium phaseoli TaxID=396 RepID=UPI0009C03F31|nr:hypothetical protein [Rhizobium phaseoli]
MDDERMREAIAKEYGFSLFRQYPEKQTAHILSKDISTLKRWRKKGKVKFVRMGDREVAYLGINIADMLIKGVKEDG